MASNPGPGHFEFASRAIRNGDYVHKDDADLAQVIIAIRALTAATLAQAAATASLIEDEKLQREWRRVTGR